jgi:hypothetical protein
VTVSLAAVCTTGVGAVVGEMVGLRMGNDSPTTQTCEPPVIDGLQPVNVTADCRPSNSTEFVGAAAGFALSCESSLYAIWITRDRRKKLANAIASDSPETTI